MDNNIIIPQTSYYLLLKHNIRSKERMHLRRLSCQWINIIDLSPFLISNDSPIYVKEARAFHHLFFIFFILNCFVFFLSCANVFKMFSSVSEYTVFLSFLIPNIPP